MGTKVTQSNFPLEVTSPFPLASDFNSFYVQICNTHRKIVQKWKESSSVKRATEIVNTKTHKIRERISKEGKQFLDKKKNELKQKMNMPPFVRTVDKLYSFTPMLSFLSP